VKYQNVMSDSFITEERIGQYGVGIGDDTVLVGRLIGHDGKLRNVPTIRAGIIAQMPDFDNPVETEVGAQEAYLVETRPISGYSGSPVFVWIPAHRCFKDVRQIMGRELDRLFFLGVDCGHVPD